MAHEPEAESGSRIESTSEEADQSEEVFAIYRSEFTARLVEVLFRDRTPAIWACNANADEVERMAEKPGAELAEIIVAFNALSGGKGTPQLVLESVDRDTAEISVANAEVLTRRMGTTGAECFLAGATFSLTSVPGIDYVWFEFEEGEHAAPGRYSRARFPYLWPLGSGETED